METYALKNALTDVYTDWEQATRGGYYSYTASIGKRRAVLYSAMQTHLPRLQALEAQIGEWADRRGVRGQDEKQMWERAARIRRAMANTNPDDVSALFPV